MNISSISNSAYNTPVSFKSRVIGGTNVASVPIPVSERVPLKHGQYYLSNGSIFRSETSKMFREDINWSNFAQYLEKRFSGCEKVNTYDYGCADAKEAFSFVMAVDNGVNNPDKFYPVQAKDIIKIAQLRLAEKNTIVSKDEYAIAKEALELSDEEMEKYFTPGYSKVKQKHCYRLNDEVKQNIEFKQANILDDIESIDSETPSLVMCRNMWPYISPNEYGKYAKALFDKLAPGSTVVIGGFDNQGAYKISDTNSFRIALVKAGFKANEEFLTGSKYPASVVYEKN